MLTTRLGLDTKTTPALGLTEQECDAVEREAFRLMVQNRVIAVARQEDETRGVSMSIFCEQGRAHVIGHCHDAYYVLDPDQIPLMVSGSFGRVLNIVRSFGHSGLRRREITH